MFLLFICKITFSIMEGCLWGREARRIWWGVWGITLWSIWLFRNGIVYKDVPRDINNVVELIQGRSWHMFQGNAKSKDPLGLILGLVLYVEGGDHQPNNWG